MKRNLRVALAAGLFSASLAMAVPAARGATSIDVSTNSAANWTITGGGLTNATPDVINGSGLSFTSNGLASGTPLAGFNPSSFDGYWTATDTFTIPAGATGASFSFSTFAADDRAVLFLNGTRIAATGSDGPGTGTFVFTDGGAETTTNFDNATSGTVTTGLNVGGTNTLMAVINNTTGGIRGTLSPLVGTNGTDFTLTGAVSYSAAGTGGTGSPAAVPLPAAGWTGLGTILGLTMLGAAKRRRHAWARV